jgi:MATE family multidrug resistance protein
MTPAAERAGREAAATLRLAGPVMVARAGILVMFTVDTLFTGFSGADQLAYLGLGLAALTVFLLMAIGLLQGILILAAQAVGARDFAAIGEIWRTGIVIAAAIALFLLIPGLFAEQIFLLTGQDPAIAAAAAPIAFQFAWGGGGILLYVACSYVLEALGRPSVGMVIILVLNVVNILLDAVFAAGWGGFVEPMGAFGAVMTTSALRWCAFFAALAFLLSMKERPSIQLDGSFLGAARSLAPRLFRLGTPMAVSQGLENGAYTTLVFLAGHLGAAALAAHQVTMNLVQLAFMVAVGMSAATAVRVGRAVGAGDKAGVAAAGWTGIALGFGLMIPIGLLFITASRGVAGVFIPEGAAALDVATNTIFAAGFSVILSGTMVVTMGALRGTGDTVTPMGLYAAAFWLVAIPAASVLAFDYQLAAPGLIYGLIVGVATGAILLASRFALVSQREPRRA